MLPEKTTTTFREKRAAERHLAPFHLAYSELQLSGKPFDPFESKIINLSSYGMIFKSSRAFAEGTVLHLEINLPRWEKFSTKFIKFDDTSISKPFIAIGRVVRTEPVDDSAHLLAVYLDNIDPDHRQTLDRYLKTIRAHTQNKSD